MGKFVVSLHQPGSYVSGQAVVLKLHESGSGENDFISNGIVKLEVNKAGTFEFDILPSHSCYSMLRRYIQYVSVKEVSDEEESTPRIVFYGRILSLSLSFNGTKHVTCEGLLSNLLDCPVYNSQRFEGAPSSDRLFTMTGNVFYMYMEAINAYRNSVRNDIDIAPLSGTGAVYDEVLDDIDVSNGMSVGDFIMNELVEVYGGLIKMEYNEHENGDITGEISWVKDPSTSGFDGETINQPIQFGVNLLDLTAECGSDEIMTGIVPVWNDENGDMKWISLEATDVDDSQYTIYRPYVEGSAGGLGAVGIQLINIPGASTQTVATAYASGYVNRYCQYNLSVDDFDSYTVKAMDLHYANLGLIDPINVYSMVQLLINAGAYTIAKTLMCTSMELNIDSPEISSYTFEVFRPKASSNDKYLTREMVKYTSGTPNSQKYTSADNMSF